MDFFSEPNHEKCLDCKTENTTGREVLWTNDEGKLMWVCPACAAQRQASDARRAQKENDDVDFALDMY